MAKTATRDVELEPIDRLEEKVKLLVAMVDRMTADQTRAAEENQRLTREIDALRARARVERGADDRALDAARTSATSSARASARCSTSSKR